MNNQLSSRFDNLSRFLSLYHPGEDIFLPWSCCNPDYDFQALVPTPKALANTIRGRLMAKSKEEHVDELHDDGDDRHTSVDDVDSQSQVDSERQSPRLNKNHRRRKNQGHRMLITKMIQEGPIIEPRNWCRFSTSRAARWHFHRY